MAAAHGVAVLEVVVYEAGVVQQFAGGRPGDGGLDGETDRSAGTERKLGAEPLSARGEVLTDDGAETIKAGARGEAPDKAFDRFDGGDGWRRTVTRFGRRHGAGWLWRGGVRHAIGP